MNQPNVPDKHNQSIYSLVGGEDAVYKLVNSFYDIIESHPGSHKLHVLHLCSNGIPHSRVEQFNLLSGFLGVSSLYVEKHGHSNVRQMHEHVEIDNEAKDIWLKCMSMTIDAIGIGANTKDKLISSFTSITNLLVNRTE